MDLGCSTLCDCGIKTLCIGLCPIVSFGGAWLYRSSAYSGASSLPGTVPVTGLVMTSI